MDDSTNEPVSEPTSDDLAPIDPEDLDEVETAGEEKPVSLDELAEKELDENEEEDEDELEFDGDDGDKF